MWLFVSGKIVWAHEMRKVSVQSLKLLLSVLNYLLLIVGSERWHLHSPILLTYLGSESIILDFLPPWLLPDNNIP